MKKLLFLGNGKVVQFFLDQYSDTLDSFDVRIYNKSDINQQKTKFPSSNLHLPQNIIFYCCSADEKYLLKQKQHHSREVVAIENIKITTSLISKGYLSHGIIFVLTNPSEVVAEYIRTKTNNPYVYALGISADIIRYYAIFHQKKIQTVSFYNLIGLHYLNPIPLIETQCKRNYLIAQLKKNNEHELLSVLGQLLQQKIKSEFVGFQPPIEGGAQAIHYTINALLHQKNFLVSGPNIHKNSFMAGSLDPNSLTFTPSSPQTQAEKQYLDHSISKHKTLLTSIENLLR